MKIGIMQGRLSPIYNGKIQKFPSNHWQSEFFIAKALGINLIEWTIDIENFFQNPILTNKGRKQIKKLQKFTGINIASITTDCFMQSPIWGNDSKKTINKLKKLISACGSLKIKYIIFPLVDNSSLKNKKTELKLIKILDNFNKILEKNSVKILFESDYPPKELKKFISSFKSKNFGINYDSGNSASLNYNLEEEFTHFGKFIKNIHLKDRLKNSHTIKLGKGNANFKKLFKNIKKINYKGNLILQTARSDSGEHIKEIMQNLNFIKKF